jgi:glycosyltransferase involved in cell wall biosynthesis
MKILYITPSFQHPKMRGPTRCYHFTKELSQRHEMTLLALEPEKVKPEAMQEMQSYTRNIFTFSTNGASEQDAGFWGEIPVIGNRLEQEMQYHAGIREMKKAFNRLLRKENFDLVLFHGKHVFPVIEKHRALPIVIDFCDATSMRVQSRMQYASGKKRLLLAARYLQIRQIEKKLIQKTPHIVFISQRDREAILGANDRSTIVPIGVDLDFWHRRTAHPKNNCLVFTGVMNYAPNEDAAKYLARKILPHIQHAVPDAKVLIVGRDPSPSLQQLAKKQANVTVTGFVDDVRDYLEKASVFVAPLRYGSGVQNKVLEAMAMQVPVVATSVAADGLRVDGVDEPPVYTADGEKEFAGSVIALLQNESERQRLANQGREYVKQHFVWARNAEKLEALCLTAVNERNGRSEKF